MNYIFFLLCITAVNLAFCDENMGKFNVAHIDRANRIVGMLVIGGGPAGLTAAMNGANLGIPTLVLTGYDLGGQINQTSTIENMPGFRKGSAMDLVNVLYDQVKDFGAVISEQKAESIDIDGGWPYKVLLDSGEIIQAMSIIIATGSEVKKTGVVGEDKYFGQGVSPCAKCDGHFLRVKILSLLGVVIRRWKKRCNYHLTPKKLPF